MGLLLKLYETVRLTEVVVMVVVVMVVVAMVVSMISTEAPYLECPCFISLILILFIVSTYEW